MYILLFITGTLLIIFNSKAIKKEKNSFEFSLKEANLNLDDVDLKLTQVRREFAETITELQKEILELKEIISEMKSENHNSDKNENELLKEIGNYKKKFNENVEVFEDSNEINSINNSESENSVYKEKSEISEDVNPENAALKEISRIEDNTVYTEENIIKDNNKGNENRGTSNNLKVEDVKNLFQQGLTVDEVAAKLNIGKGEVLLIKELYLK